MGTIVRQWVIRIALFQGDMTTFLAQDDEAAFLECLDQIFAGDDGQITHAATDRLVR
jgi:hypothetical protein